MWRRPSVWCNPARLPPGSLSPLSLLGPPVGYFSTELEICILCVNVNRTVPSLLIHPHGEGLLACAGPLCSLQEEVRMKILLGAASAVSESLSKPCQSCR